MTVANTGLPEREDSTDLWKLTRVWIQSLLPRKPVRGQCRQCASKAVTGDPQLLSIRLLGVPLLSDCVIFENSYLPV
jgi:hypothetical protein